MSTPRIAGCGWFVENPHRAAIYNRNFHVEGKWKESGHLNPWVAHQPDSEHYFGTWDDAARHLIKEGWRK